MKRILIPICMIVTAAVIFCSCAKNAPAESMPSAAPARPSDAAVPAEPVPESLPQLEGISAEDIAYIDYFNGSTDPETPALQYSSAEETGQILDWLKSIRPAEPVAPAQPADEVPGGGSRFVLHCFDGRSETAVFYLDTVSIGDRFYGYEADDRPSDPAVTLHTEQAAYPADTEKISYTAFNDTGKTLAIQLIPQLERMTAAGWERIEYDGIGFCGTPDSFPEGITSDSFDLSWFEDIPAGTYRLSVYVFEDGEQFLISTVFRLE